MLNRFSASVISILPVSLSKDMNVLSAESPLITCPSLPICIDFALKLIFPLAIILPSIVISPLPMKCIMPLSLTPAITANMFSVCWVLSS